MRCVALLGTALLTQPGCAQLPAALDSNKEFALATSALLTEIGGGEHDLLGAEEKTPRKAAAVMESLERSWGIENRDDLLAMLEWLERHGQRERFREEAEILSVLTPAEFTARANYVRDEGVRARLEYVRAWSEKLGERGLLAWDLVRYVNLCRWGYLVGFFSEEETWDYILPVARRLRENYSSWQELGRHYLIGRRYWRPLSNHVEAEYAYSRLLLDETSPWRRHPWSDRGDTAAILTLASREGGLTCYEIRVLDRPDVASLNAAFEEAFGCTPRIQREVRPYHDYTLAGDCISPKVQGPTVPRDPAVSPVPPASSPGAPSRVTLNLDPVFERLRESKVTHVVLYWTHDGSLYSRITPAASRTDVAGEDSYYTHILDLREPVPEFTLAYGAEPIEPDAPTETTDPGEPHDRFELIRPKAKLAKLGTSNPFAYFQPLRRGRPVPISLLAPRAASRRHTVI